MRTSDTLLVGISYTRINLRRMFGISDATINTGVFQRQGHSSIWLFVTEHKTPDRTQYRDFLNGDVLDWDGQSSGRTDDRIINHTADGNELVLFYRREKYEYAFAAFRFEGAFEYVSHTGSNPAHFLLERASAVQEMADSDVAGYYAEEAHFIEGDLQERITNHYERNPRLRAAAVSIHGTRCKVCGFDFNVTYGERGKGFIEVHHIKPLSSAAGPTLVDPRNDMTVLCANCHRMIHRRKDEIPSAADLIGLLQDGNI